jgi:hypothetical protein
MEYEGFPGFAAHVFVRIEGQGKSFLYKFSISVLKDGFCFAQQSSVTTYDFFFLLLGIYNHRVDRFSWILI